MLPRLLAAFATLAPLAAVVLAGCSDLDGLRATEGGATSRKCGTKLTPEAIVQSESIFTSLLAENERSDTVDDTTGNFTVPVYFNVLYAGSAVSEGNISDSQILDQMEVLNNDYRDTGLSFELEGIIRTFNVEWFRNATQHSAEDAAMKDHLRRGDAKTLNIYTVGFNIDLTGDSLGYATFPVNYSSYPKEDGVVVIYSSLPEGSNRGRDLGRTLTHEVGHWVGLYHTFEGESCDGPGDYVDDTPAEAEASWYCETGRNTCPNRPGSDPITNYMDYSLDCCTDNFTPGQIARLKSQLKVFREVDFSPQPQERVPLLVDQTLAK